MPSPGNRSIVLHRLQMLHAHGLLAAPLGTGNVSQPGADQHQRGVPVREAAHRPRPAPNLPVQPLNDVVGAAFSGEKIRGKNKGNGSTCLARRNLPKKRYFLKKSFCFGLRHVILYLNIRSRKSAMTTDVALRELPRLVCHIWLGPDPGQSVQPSRAGGYVPSLSGRGRSPFASVVYIERNASI